MYTVAKIKIYLGERRSG